MIREHGTYCSRSLDGARTVSVEFALKSLRSALRWRLRETEIVSSFFGPPANVDDKSQRDGIEVTPRLSPAGRLTFGGSYFYLDATGSVGLAEVHRREHSGSPNIAYSLAEGRGLVKLGVFYNADMQDYTLNAFTFTQGLVKPPEYTVVNPAAHYDVTETFICPDGSRTFMRKTIGIVFSLMAARVAAYSGAKIRLGGERETAFLKQAPSSMRTDATGVAPDQLYCRHCHL